MLIITWKSQTHREMGTESHGSYGEKIAGLPSRHPVFLQVRAEPAQKRGGPIRYRAPWQAVQEGPVPRWLENSHG